MSGHKFKRAVSVTVMLTLLHLPSHAQSWVAINDELSMDPESVTRQGELNRVTIKLKGNVHDILIFCKKRALLFNEKMIAASETPAGTSLVSKVCDAPRKWYEVWK